MRDRGMGRRSVRRFLLIGAALALVLGMSAGTGSVASAASAPSAVPAARTAHSVTYDG
jgi:hypothetical protein